MILHSKLMGNSFIQEKGDQAVIEQIKPVLFAPDSRNYYGIGKQIAQAFSIGKEIG
jgi:hypothetical protein